MDKYEKRHMLKKAKLEMRQAKELARKTAMDAFTRVHEVLKLHRKQREVNLVGYATRTMSWWRHPIRHVYMEPPRWVSISDEIQERFYTDTIYTRIIERDPDIMIIRGGRLRMINPMEEARMIQVGMEEIDEEFRIYYKCLRTKIRHTRLLRNELMEAVRMRECIRACRTIKEELMASVWHPRRVEALIAQGYESYLFDE